jgi:two-component system, cell cycle sensor histidine kinase PleC
VNISTPIDSQNARIAVLDEDAGLIAGEAPALVIDTEGLALVAANRAASSFLGLDGSAARTLDPAMPAWAAIRAFAATEPRTEVRQDTLLFWTPHGPSACPVKLEIVRRGSRTLVRATLATTEPAVVTEDASSRIRPSDKDLATLQEIARRIRAGTDTLPVAAATPPVEPPSSLPPPLDFRQLPGVAAASLDNAAVCAKQAMPPDALAKLAHELRTPLSAIVSLAEIMRDEQLGAMGNPRYRAYASDIHDSAQHTLDLVGTMLDSGCELAVDSSAPATAALTFAAINLEEIGRSCVSSMQPIGTRNGVTLTAEPTPGLPMVHADRRAIRQIILNILSNALRFTPCGGTITLSAKQRADRTLALTVADTGTGMRPAEIARALAAGTAGNNRRQISVATGRVGSGIGLPLVRELIEAHGGALAIEGVAGQGTRVTVVFPADRVVQP